jgi:CDP-6-deoxy-D-xylo-4-hexulose-3-dehydrase
MGSPLFDRRSSDHFEAYRFILPGYNVRPMEISGAIGREQLKKLPAMTAARRRNLAVFQELFAGDDRFILQRENGKSSCFSFTIILNPAREANRDKVFASLEEAGIGFRMITGGCFLKHDVIQYYDYVVVDGGVPNADLAHERGFFVGNSPQDLKPQIERLRDVLDRACK